MYEHFVVLLKNQKRMSFLCEFLDDQFQHAMAGGSRQYIYPTNMIRFGWSAEACLKFLRGAGNYGKTKDNNSLDNFNLFLPCEETLKSYRKSPYYGYPETTKTDLFVYLNS